MLGRHIRTLGRANELTGIPQAALPLPGTSPNLWVWTLLFKHRVLENLGDLCVSSRIFVEKQKMNQYSESERHRMAIWKCLVLRPKAAVGEWCRSSRKIWGQLQQLGARLQCDNHRYRWYRMVSDIVPNGMMIPKLVTWDILGCSNLCENLHKR